MGPEIGLGVTRLAMFLIVAAGLALLWVPRRSAEFVVLILTIGVALAMLAVVALFARMGTPRWSRPRSEHVTLGGLGDQVSVSQTTGETSPDDQRVARE
jgi:hypothetical protein